MNEVPERIALDLNEQRMWLPALRMFAWKKRSLLLHDHELRALEIDPGMEDVNCWQDCPAPTRDLLITRAEKWMEKNRTPHYDDMTKLEQVTWAQKMYLLEQQRKQEREERRSTMPVT